MNKIMDDEPPLTSRGWPKELTADHNLSVVDPDTLSAQAVRLAGFAVEHMVGDGRELALAAAKALADLAAFFDDDRAEGEP